jgi:hypothetical protein
MVVERVESDTVVIENDVNEFAEVTVFSAPFCVVSMIGIVIV